MLAREHTQLILPLEVFQTDGTGLLWEEGGYVREDWRRTTLTHQLIPSQHKNLAMARFPHQPPKLQSEGSHSPTHDISIDQKKLKLKV